MCGINGIFAYHYAANAIDRAELVRTRDHMAARGGDGHGAWVARDDRIGLGHRRLAIIDLSKAGAQPMISPDGALAVTFNGEIYNHAALRRELEARGCVFRSASDTEVLLHLYAERGADMVHALRGMFAFAIWDGHRRQLLLARDPLGIKPLYYADDGWTFRFASQVKALLAGGAVSREPEPAGLAGFYLWGSVPEPFTTHQAIRAVPAGATLLVDRIGAREPRPYHAIAAVYRDAAHAGPPVDRPAPDAVRAALLDSVRAHLVADVPVGAFLSAGIDSGALVGLMRDVGQDDIATLTVAFEEFRQTDADEAPLAAQVARRYGTRHTTRVVTRQEFDTDLPRFLDAMDQPSIDGINTWFAAKTAREIGLKVAISGLGGDELFGGYPSFRDIPRWVRSFALPSRVPGLGRLARTALTPLVRTLGAHPKAAGLVELGGTYPGAYMLRRGLFMPWELEAVLGRELAALGLRRLQPMRAVAAVLDPDPANAHARIATLETALYMRNQLLRDTDWASMAHGLEVRVPLVDAVLLARLAPLGAAGRLAGGKQLLAAAPSRALPAEVSNRPKTGFATPIASWRPTSTRAPQWARAWSLEVGARASREAGADAPPDPALAA